jgi:cytochrome c oxidase subunit 1
MIATTLLIGLLGIVVWGHHMFVAGLNPFAGTVFSVSSLAIALPSAAKVLSWLATAWGSRGVRGRMATPMLFALGFVSFFIAGGLTGPILAQPILDEYLHNTFFVIAHFHLIMSMAAVFGLFCGIYYWYPLLFGRRLSETLGRWHFWLTLLGAYATFLPMYITGLGGEPRHYAQLNGIAGPGAKLLALTLPLQRHITYSAIVLMAAQVLFFWNVQRTARGPMLAEENPWQATTLEWAPGAMHDAEDDLLHPTRIERRAYREPCIYSDDGEGFSPQWSEEAALHGFPIPLKTEAE